MKTKLHSFGNEMLFQSGFLSQPLRAKEPAELNKKPEERSTEALEKSRLLN
jgi:hypothetical protein